MIRYRNIIPLVIFILSLFSGYLYKTGKDARIDKMIREAASNEQPLILVDFGHHIFNGLRAYDFSGNNAPILNSTSKYPWSGLSYHYSLDGRIIFVMYSKIGDMKTYVSLDLPDSQLHPVMETHADDFIQYVSPARFNYHKHLWRALYDDENFYFRHLITGETIYPETNREFPWFQLTDSAIDDVKLFMSDDGRNAYAMVDVTNSTGATSRIVWRYDLLEDQWIELVEDSEIIDMYVGSNEDVLGLFLWDGLNMITRFINSHTGDEILEIKDAILPSIGRRWAACVDQSCLPDVSILVYNMENDWEEHVIDIPYQVSPRAGNMPLSAVSMIVYEPGVE